MSTELKSPRLLVVDDNPATLYATSRVLRGAGWDVLQAENGTEALNLSRTGVDLVVLDVMLPDIDGFEVCRRLRSEDLTPRIAVILLSSSFVQDTDKVVGLDAGADGYLTRPVEPPVLLATVNAFLRARQSDFEKHQRELEFRTVFENALNGIFLIDQELRVGDVNPALCAVLQRTREQLIGQPLLDWAPADRRDEALEIFERLRLTGVWRGVFPLQRANGELAYLDWSLSRHSMPELWLAIVSDITSRLEVERQREELLISERAARADAERANRIKDDFLATLSHELRTPLNAIVGWSQLLQLGHFSPEEQKDAVAAIHRNATLQAQMIADLLDVSRITSGKLRLEMEATNPVTVVEAAIAVVGPAAQAKSIRIESTLDPYIGQLSADPARLQQVVWNLVNNAVKFTPKGGNIRVRLGRVNSQVEIAVQDSGQGISTELMPTIFERFRQGDSSTTRGEGGLGLGLAIAKQLVELHGGTIHAESGGLGKGALFRVRLPISSVSTKSAAILSGAPNRASIEERAARLQGVRILIVDDDPDARRLTKRVLSDFGAHSEVADGVITALTAVEEFKPHVLVSDLGMPERDGFDLIREIRSRGYTFQQLPAVALTAFARTEDRQKAFLAGFQMHLTKPVDPSELSAAIATLVSRTG